MMRLTAILLFACLLKSRLAYSQTGSLISLNEKNVTLERALKDICDQIGYAYGGSGDWPKISHTVSLSVKKVSLQEVLDICFADQPLVYEVNFSERMITVHPRPTQDRVIHGFVFDENKEPVVLASVVAPGDASTATSEKGEFYLATHYADPRLIVSSIGYETQVLPMPEAGRMVNVTLKSRVGSLEVVVVHTGYQDVKRKNTTGSVDAVDNDLLNRRVSTNVLDRIDGVTSSVLFNKNIVAGVNQSSISIRGRSTIFANPNPLIVVDNFPYPGDLNNINPADVESITVLKDAAAASIWGAFSGNGVIVITTKKGKLNSPPKLSFSSSLTVGEKPDLYYQKILSSGDYIDLETDLVDSTYYDAALMNPLNSALTPVVELLGAARAGQVSESTAQAEIDALRKVDTRRDLNKYFYRPSLNSQYALNYSGGSARDQYYLSAGYDKNLSNLARNEYDRITLTGNNSHQIVTNKIELNTGFAFTASTTYLNNTGAILINYPYAQLAGTHGNALAVNYGLREPYIDTISGGQLLDWRYRPLDELRNADNKLTLTDYRINIGLRYSILKGLNAQAYYQFGRGDSDYVNYRSVQTYYVRNLINEYTQISGLVPYPIPRGGILDEIDNKYTANNVRLQLNYNDSLFRHGRLNLIGGGEVRDIEGEDRVTRLYGYNPALGSSMPVDYINAYLQYGAASSKQIPYFDSKIGTSERYVSYYVNGEYSYLGRYMVSANARRDESNLFGVRTNQKGVPLWSTGLSWEISKEKFYHVAGLPYLKLRVTDGYNGNVDRSVSAYTTATVNNGVNIYQAVTATIVNPPNPTLRWEKVHIYNFGVDFNTARNRLSGTVEYYIKTGLDLIGQSPIDPTRGVSVFIGNTANMVDHGIDFSLHANNDLGTIHWNSVLLFSYVLDKVTRYEQKLGAVNNYLTATTINPLAGRPLYSIFALKWRGLDPTNGNPKGMLNGKDTDKYSDILGSNNLNDLIYRGPVNPPVFGSWRNSFYWKQWGLSFNILYKFGYVFRRSSMFYFNFYTNAYPGHPDYERRWQHPGDEKHTDVPSIEAMPGDPNEDQFYQNSEVLIVKGDHIRLQDVQLSYDWGKQGHPHLPVQLIRFYLYANNLGILWKANHYGIDPDYVSGIPTPRTLAFGVKIDY